MFRWLVRLYPRAFRARYGQELLDFFHAERSRPRHGGPVGALRFWRHTLSDLAAATFRGRVRNLPSVLLMRISDLPRHVRLSVRSLRRQPGYTAIVACTLALGMAAMLVVFALVDATLLEAIPFEEGDEVVFVQGTTVADREDIRGASLGEFRVWEGAAGFAGLAAVETTVLNLGLSDGTRLVNAEMVTGAYFELLRVRPLIGRLLGPEDDVTPDGHPVAVLHEDLWEEHFARDAGILGRPVRLNDALLTVVGVVPARFGGTGLDTRVWVPLMMGSINGRSVEGGAWGNRFLFAVGRLAAGVGLEEAQAQVDGAALELARIRPETNEGRTGSLTAARSAYLGPAEDMLWVLLVASGVLLLVATTNAAGVMTVRGAARRDEQAVRLALGASRATLVVRALVDALVLATVAAGLAWLLAGVALRWLIANLPDGALPPFADPRLDAETLLFAFGVVAVAALLSGIVPALYGARGDLTLALRDARTSAAGGEIRWRSPQQLLVVAEVAIAVVLLIGTGLMGRTLLEKLAVEEGFEAAGLSAVRVGLAGDVYADGAAVHGFAEQARDRLLEIPGVDRVSYGSDMPLGGGASASLLALDPTRPEEHTRFYRHRVAPDFRQVLGIGLVEGRDFSRDDGADAPVVIQVSRDFADRFLGGPRAAVGRTLLLYPGFGDIEATVVGVVENVRWRDLTTEVGVGGDDPDLYVSFEQAPAPGIAFAMRTEAADGLLPRIQEALRLVDPDVPTNLVVSMEDRLRQQTAGDRLSVTVLAAFAVAALLLAGIAVYGALASAVAHRRRELAIRLALGASTGNLRRSVLVQGVQLAAAGAAIGSFAALVLNRWLAGVLFGVTTLDLPTYLSVVALLALVALVATWIPALRATRVEPHAAL